MIPSITDMVLNHGNTRPVSPESADLLAKRDIDGLLALNRSRFGGWTMKDEPDEDDSDDDDNDDGDDDSDDDGDKDDDDDEDTDKASKKTIADLKAENTRRRKKAAEQDRRIKELERRLEGPKPKAKSKEKSEEDDTEDAADTTELQATLDKVTRTNEDLLIRLEFTNLVTGDKAEHQPKNLKTVLKALDLSDVTIEDDGTVAGLDDALEALFESDPYLFKSDKDDDEDEDDEKPKRRRSGQQTRSSRSRKGGNPNRDKLVEKYPALRR